MYYDSKIIDNLKTKKDVYVLGIESSCDETAAAVIKGRRLLSDEIISSAKIQAEYGSLDAWGGLTDGSKGEPNAKAVIFGFHEMINEGIDIMNEETGNDVKPLTLKQTGRLITDIGIAEATKKLNKTVIDSTQSAEKNA